MERLTEARSITDDALRRGVEERWEKTIAAHVAAERALADSTITSMESRLAEVERERDGAKRLAYLGDHHFPDLTWKARCEEAVADLRAAQSRLARIESLARAYLAAVDAESGQAIALAELRRALEGGE